MAVVAPLLFALIFGIIEFGYVFTVQEMLTNAVREACRVGVLQGATPAEVQSRFDQAISGMGITVDPGMLSIPTQAVLDDPPGDVVEVSVAIPYANVSLVGSALGLNMSRTLGSTCSMRKE